MTKLFLILLLSIAPSLAIACGCDRPMQVDDLPPNAIIFVGEAIDHAVDDAECPPATDTIPCIQMHSEVVTFRVISLLRGQAGETIKVGVNGHNSCDLVHFEYKRGDKYALSILPPRGESFANERHVYWNNFCSLRHRI